EDGELFADRQVERLGPRERPGPRAGRRLSRHLDRRRPGPRRWPLRRTAVAVGKGIEAWPETEEVPDEKPDPGAEHAAGGQQHQEMHLDLELGIEEAEAENPFEIDLGDAGGPEGKGHAEHPGELQPESPVPDRGATDRAFAAERRQ